MTDTTMRREFEAWIAKDCGDLTKFGRGANTHYKNSAVNNAWSGWQAATERATPQWQPIETAPKDFPVLLHSTPKANDGQFGRVADGYWLQTAYGGNGAWIWPYVHNDPTHWMPLPPPPAIRQGGGT